MPDPLTEIFSRHAVYLEGAKTSAEREFEDFLKAMEKDLLTQFNALDDLESLKGRRLTRFLRAIRATLDAGYSDYANVWRKQLEGLAKYESGFTVRALGQVVNAEFALPTASQIITAAFARPLSVTGIDGGSLLETFFKDWTDKTKQRIEGAVRLSAAQGEGLNDLVRRVRGTRKAKYRDGIVQIARRDAALMVRTASAHVAQSARTSVYEANADIVAGEKFVAVLDGKTSTICRSLSGQTFDVGKGPMPPLHIACRSTRVPELAEGLDILSTGGDQFSRGADGIDYVDGDLTYYGWLKTQPKAFQDSVLGETRGKLLRNGGLSADRFSKLQLDKNFAPLSLDEMRALEPTAFERAGL